LIDALDWCVNRLHAHDAMLDALERLHVLLDFDEDWLPCA
jgi:hypothetical protein